MDFGSSKTSINVYNGSITNKIGEAPISDSSENSVFPADGTNKCVPLTVDFCVNNTKSPQQRRVDETTLLHMATVIESGCYPFAANFLCSWGVECGTEDELPCRDYCDEFMANCGHKLSHSMKERIKCGGDWKSQGSCRVKPGCVQELYNSGFKDRLCDGTMDCIGIQISRFEMSTDNLF